MQACRLTIAEVTDPLQVVKVWVDPASESLSLMLSDSSCLLYKFKFPSSAGNFSIPVAVRAPVTDACFLRLMAASARAVKAQKPLRRSVPCDRGETSKAVKRKEQTQEDGATVVFLATMPGRVGSRTVIRAWVRQNQGDTGFSRAAVEVKDIKGGSEGLGRQTPLAGVLDLPHGFALKIAASVNVFVLYSAAAGKIWIMAAKVKVREDSAKLEGHSAKLEGLSAKLEGTSISVENRVCISLIKCSVLDCSGPIYSIRLSLQHMLLGEENGVRVWLLRPLVKGRARKSGRGKVSMPDKCKEELVSNDARKDRALEQVNVHPNSLENGRRAKSLDQADLQANGRKELKTDNPHKGVREFVVGNAIIANNIDSKGRETITNVGGEVVSGNVAKGALGDKACEKAINGEAFSKKNLLEKLDNGDAPGLTLKKAPRNGVLENVMSEGCKNDSGIYCNGGKIDVMHAVSMCQGKEFADSVVNSMNGGQCNCNDVMTTRTCLERAMEVISDETTETGSAVGNLVNNTVCEREVKSLALKRKNGQVCLDDFCTQLSQLSSMSLSSSSGSSSLSGSLAPLLVTMSASASSSGNCPSVLGSACSMERTIHAPVSSVLAKGRSYLKVRDSSGKVCSFFVPFEDVTSTGDKASRSLGKTLRAIAIHDLSQAKFVVLDSTGDLHILSLQNPVCTFDSQNGIAGHSLKHIKCSMKVNMLAVFPETSSSSSQKFWVSDGRYSIHVLSLPEANVSHCQSDKDPVDENPLQLSVMQAVFSSDSVRAIAAMSANATFVLTQGNIIAYSIGGS